MVSEDTQRNDRGGDGARRLQNIHVRRPVSNASPTASLSLPPMKRRRPDDEEAPPPTTPESSSSAAEDASSNEEEHEPGWVKSLVNVGRLHKSEIWGLRRALDACNLVVTPRPWYCHCDSFDPDLAISRTAGEKEIVCGNCCARCPRCDNLFVHGHDDDEYDDQVCCECAYQDTQECTRGAPD